MMISREEEEVEKQKDEEMAAILEEIRLNEENEMNDNGMVGSSSLESRPSTSVEQSTSDHTMSKKEGKRSEYAQPNECLDETYQYDDSAPAESHSRGIEDADNVNENENQEEMYEAQLKAAIEASLNEQ